MDNQSVCSDEEGFYSNQLQINHKIFTTRKLSSSLGYTMIPNHNGLVAQYLSWTGPLMKEPEEALHTQQIIEEQKQIQLLTETNKIQDKKSKQQGHPFQLYARNQNYQLVYNRNEEILPLEGSKNFIKNNIQLRHVGSKDKKSFSKKIPSFKLKNIDKSLNNLVFDSKFECGNLHCAYKYRHRQEYVLFVSNDTNSFGYTQWFYFSIRNNMKDIRYSFHIQNFKKKHSFFRNGCKPAVFSLKKSKIDGLGWYKHGLDITYKESPIRLNDHSKYYSLSFSTIFDHQDDYIMIAMSIPYSYSRLINFISDMKQHTNNPQKNHNHIAMQIDLISKTLCGNNLPQLTIKKKSKETKLDQNSKQNRKRMIIILARQHSGQVWSSYMMEGIIRQLLCINSSKGSKNREVNWLLDHYIFKIYPMVNIDGVIYGNSRCDITGSDLNRKWKDTSHMLYPQISKIKKRIAFFKDNYEVDICYDLHGHSKNYNIFTYGCRDNTYTSRVLPLLISKYNTNFYMPSCTFGLSKYKQGTARAIIYKMIQTQNVLTVQTSYYGSKNKQIVDQFTEESIMKFSSDLIKATKLFLDRQFENNPYEKTLKEIRQNIQEYLKYDEINGSDSGSDSDPEGDQIDLDLKIKDIFDSDCINMQSLKQTKFSKQISKQLKNSKKEDSSKYGKNYSKIINAKIQKKSQKYIKTIQSKTIQPKTNISSLNNQTINQNSFSQQQNFRNNKYSFHKKKQAKSQNKNTQKLQTIHKKFVTNNPPTSSQTHHYQTLRQVSEKKNTQSLPISVDSKSFRANAMQSRLKKQGQSPDIIQNRLKDIRKSDDFVRKFERFIPISTNSRTHPIPALFEQQIYEQDQKNLLTVLYENKRKIQMQKIRRDIQKSTKIVQRQNRLKPSKPQQVIDFKTFKQNQKINRNIKKIVKLDYKHYLNKD